MAAAIVRRDEQIRLINECRASGLTDHQWCVEHGIRPGTFYNWIKRLKQSGYTAIPNRATATSLNTTSPEVVKIYPTPDVGHEMVLPSHGDFIDSATDNIPAVEILISGITVRLNNNASQNLIERTITALSRCSLC